MDKIRDCEYAAFVFRREECREEVRECRPGGRETRGLHAAEEWRASRGVCLQSVMVKTVFRGVSVRSTCCHSRSKIFRWGREGLESIIRA